MSDTLTAAKVEEIVNSIVTRTHNLLTPFTSPDPTAFSNPPNGASYRVTATTATGQTIVGESNPLSTVTGGGILWTRLMSNTGVAFATAAVLANDGEYLVAGSFEGTVDFGGGFVLTNSGSGYDVFLARYSPGNVTRWARKFGVAGVSEQPRAMAVDLSGNIFMAGSFPGGSVVKLDLAGNLIWTKGQDPAALGGNTQLTFGTISCDSAGNVVISGGLKALAPTVINFGDGHTASSVVGGLDAYLVKYSAAGTCLWLNTFDTVGSDETGTCAVVDRANSDSIWFGGNASGDINFGDGYVGVAAGSGTGTVGFIAKFTSAGAFISGTSKAVAGNLHVTNSYSKVSGMKLDSSGNLLVTGSYKGGANFGGGNRQSLPDTANANGYVVKFNGSTLAWITDATVQAPTSCLLTAVTSDAANSIIVVGGFQRPITVVDNFGHSKAMSPAADPDVFHEDWLVVKYTSTGVLSWAKQFGGTGRENASAVFCDASNSIVVAGSVDANYQGGLVNFDGQGTMLSVPDLDAILVKLNP